MSPKPSPLLFLRSPRPYGLRRDPVLVWSTGWSHSPDLLRNLGVR